MVHAIAIYLYYLRLQGIHMLIFLYDILIKITNLQKNKIITKDGSEPFWSLLLEYSDNVACLLYTSRCV